MNVLLTKNGYILVDNKSEYLVNEETFIGVLKNPNLRTQLLESLGRTAIVVGRLGKQTGPSIFRKSEMKVTEAGTGSFVKEVGYYAKL